jgi:uncharacterized protein (DUF2147 family)
MKDVRFWLSAILIGFFTTSVFATAVPVPPGTPVGYWKTIDDLTGRPKSIIHIWKADNDVLMGKVIKIFPKEGHDQNKLCTACSGDKHNQPIVGMVILSGLRASQQSQWGDGSILDPENGKSYSCSLRVADNGKRLNVHGYIGIPLLGRSQTWERVDLMSDKTPS